MVRRLEREARDGRELERGIHGSRRRDARQERTRARQEGFATNFSSPHDWQEDLCSCLSLCACDHLTDSRLKQRRRRRRSGTRGSSAESQAQLSLTSPLSLSLPRLSPEPVLPERLTALASLSCGASSHLCLSCSRVHSSPSLASDCCASMSDDCP